MADDKDDVDRTRAYGFERYMMRQIPVAAFLLLVGLAASQISPHRSYPHMSVLVGMVLAIASNAMLCRLGHCGPDANKR